MTAPQFPRRSRTLAPGAVLTPAQFWAICQIARTSDPSREAARLVLVDGRPPVEAAAATGVILQSLSRLTARLRRAHDLLADAYSPPAPRSRRPVV